MTIQILPETICKDCGISFRYNPNYSTIKPVRCQKCQNLKEFKKVSIKKRNNILKHEIGLKVPKKASVNKRLDEAWSKLVRAKAGFKCEYCGSKENLTAHHIFTRARMSTRHDIKNGICLCVTHHTGNEFSAHYNPTEFMKWLKNYRGENAINQIELKSNKIVNFHKYEKELILSELLKELMAEKIK